MNDWREQERVKWDAMTDDARFDMHMTVRADRASQKLAADRLEHQLEVVAAQRDDYKDRWETLGRVSRNMIARLEAKLANERGGE